MTTIYIMRHSEPFKSQQGEMNTKDSVQLINEKTPLCVDGENLAKEMASKEEFKNIDVVYASNYVRAMSTAKYFAYNNQVKVDIDYRLGERVQGITSWDELPEDFEIRQFYDETYKIGFGENQIEVRERMNEVFDEILNKNNGKRVLIVSHATAIAFLLKRWLNIEIVDDKLEYSYKGNVLLHNYFKYCEAFKLTFDDNKELINIERI